MPYSHDITTRLSQFLASDNWGEGGGTPGLSAYEVALANGFVGSESAWLASLVGPQGDPGPQGLQGATGPTGNTGSPGDPGDPGEDGLSAYEVAVVNGFSGSEAQWLASLVGPEGPQGQQGIQGPEGPPGAGGLTAAQVIDLLHPVGSVWIGVVGTSPATLFGRGTWVAIAAGRCLVGQDTGDTDFDTLEETVGAKTVTLTATEMPAHTHTQMRLPTATGAVVGFTVDTSMSGTPATTGVVTASAGGGGAHANVQPSFVVKVWKRTA